MDSFWRIPSGHNSAFKISFCLLLFFSTLFANAQTTGSISGKVTDTSNKPLNAVNISLKGTQKGAATNANGNFRIENVSPGSYTLRITAVGYVSRDVPVKVASGQTLSVPTIVLKSKSQRLDGVEVTGEGSLVPTKETEYVARMPLANIENPQVYNVVSSKLLEKQGVVDYKTALNNVAGANPQNAYGINIIYLRGFYSNSSARNGMPVYQTANIDVANIERVEVIKGPTGTLFGGMQNYYGGLTNYVTKKPHREFETAVSYTLGSWGFNRLTADVNTPLAKDGSVLLRNNVAFQTANSWQDAGYHNRIFYAPSLVYKANERLTFSLDMDIYQYKGTPPNTAIRMGSIPGVKTFDDLKKFDHEVSFNHDQLYSNRFAINTFAKAEYQLSDNWKSTTLVNHSESSMRRILPLSTIFSLDSARVELSRYYRNINAQQIQQNFNGEFQLAGFRHRVLLGADYFSQNWVDNAAFGGKFKTLPLSGGARLSLTREVAEQFIAKSKRVFDNDNTRKTYSTYVSDVVDFTEGLHLLLSLRLDRFEYSGRRDIATGKTSGTYQQTALAPRLGVIYEVLPKELSVFANYNRGFTNRPGTDVKGNAFTPEKANQMEGGLKWEPKSKMANVTLSYYHIEVEDMVRPDLKNPGFSSQDGSVRSSGFELDAALNPVEGLSIIAGYAYNDAKILKGRNVELNGNRLRNAPQHLANFFASYNFSGALEGLDIGFGGNYSSESFAFDDNKFTLNSYTILNANMGYSVGNVRFNIRAENLTSERNLRLFQQHQAPLRVLGSVSMRF